jgi:hypothetical protein
MKICHSLLAAVLLVALVASGRNWQDCKTDTSYSFKEVKGAVHRVTTSRMYTGGDEKTLIRSGDLVSVATLQTLNDSEMTYSRNAGVCALDSSRGLRLPQPLR